MQLLWISQNRFKKRVKKVSSVESDAKMIALIFLILVTGANVLEGTENVVELCGMDMLSSSDKQENLSPIEKSDLEDKLMGDDTQKSEEENSEKSKRAVKRGTYYWPHDKPVYYSYEDGEPRKQVLEAIKMIEDYTCIKFKKVERNDKENYHINFKYARSASSLVGRQQAQFGERKFLQHLQLPDASTVGATVHEIMHALGFVHEQERPDREDYIDIHKDNIEKNKYERNFATEEVNTFGEPYDFNSIMHYGKFFFGIRKNGEKMVTMTAKEKYGGPKREIGSKGTLTTSDIIRLNRLFKCDVPRQADLQQALAKIKDKSQSELIDESKDKDIKGGLCEEFKQMHQND